MIDDKVLVSQFTSDRALLSWETANADDVSYISVNGVMLKSALRLGVLERQVRFNMLKTQNKAITVQNFLVSQVLDNVDPVEVLEVKRPLFKWINVEEAKFYRIYHTPYGGIESLIYDKRNNQFPIATVICPIDLVEGWHLFRVEAVDEFKNESTRLAWAYRQFRLPEIVNDLTIVDGSGAGLFDITIS